jgi:hypothetical protein
LIVKAGKKNDLVLKSDKPGYGISIAEYKGAQARVVFITYF